MQLFTATVAYLPKPHKEALETTQTSVASTWQFNQYGTVVVYHAHEEDEFQYCDQIHYCFGETPIREYVNGSLADNERVLLEAAFDEFKADWCLFSSNDVTWEPDAARTLVDKLATANQWAFNIVAPMCVFLLSRQLYEAMKPNLFFGYLPSGVEDDDLELQAIAAGGDLACDDFFKSLLNNGRRDSTRVWFGGSYGKGGRDNNYSKNVGTFEKRWGISPGAQRFHLRPNYVMEIRQNPKRPGV